MEHYCFVMKIFFMLRHCRENMKRGIIYGSAMASFCVEKFGIERLAELKQEEIDERVQQFVNLVQFDIELV